MTTDDFDRTSQPLGPKWVDTYTSEGGGFSCAVVPADQMPWTESEYPIQVSQSISMTIGHGGDIAAYSSLPNSSGEMVGARHKAGDPCAVCRKPFEAGHVVYADLEPNMSGTFRHRDCGDPALVKGEGE